MHKFFSFDAFVNQLIRPAKFTYSPSDLGAAVFTLHGKIYERDDFVVHNQDKNKLFVSLFKEKDQPVGNILVYLHCNCGSRIEALQFRNEALSAGYAFLCFDSRGCGHSEGDFITLGKYFQEVGRVS